MAHLEPEDRSRLISCLERTPEMGNYDERRAVLTFAGLGEIIPQINLQGNAFAFVANLIERLEGRGKVNYEHEALGLLLNTVKGKFGGDDEIQTFFDYLLTKYKLMVPAINAQKPAQWKTDYSTEKVLEKVIGENTLKHIAFLQRGLEVARSVAYIEVGDKWSGTGFMISPNLLITNHHVMPSRELLASSIFRFNFQLNFSGNPELFKDYRAQLNGIFYTNTNFDLDYSIIALEQAPGNDWGYLPLRQNSSIRKEDRVNIIQHPNGLPKQISFQNNFVAYVDQRVLQYYTSTMQGSSGSPVFDDKWEVVALHHAGGDLFEPKTMRKYFRNEGIRILAILNDLPGQILNEFNS